MNYQKHNFEPKTKLTAQSLNEIEAGIIANESAINQLDSSIVSRVNSVIADAKANGNLGSPAIIDVLELPTENINERAFYRLLTAKFVTQGDSLEDWKCYYVEALPEVGQPVTVDFVAITAYYNQADGEVYGYANDVISSVGGVPVGWYPISVLGQAFNVPWGGVITDADEVSDEEFKVLLGKDYYIYQNEWCKLPFACEKAPMFSINWDGEIGDRFVLDMSQLGYEHGTYFIKVSDQVLSPSDVLGGCYKAIYSENSHTSSWEILHDIIYERFPGSFDIDGAIVVVYDENEINTALNLPDGTITNGIYFELLEDTFRTCSLTTAPRVIKFDKKFLPNMDVDLGSLGLSLVATTGNYNHLSNKPDLSIYATTATLNKSLSVIDIDVNNLYDRISDIELQLMNIGNVDTKINEAIGAAIGGKY